MTRLLTALAAVALLAPAAHAQRGRGQAPPHPAPAPAARRVERVVPFKPGETLTYDVSWSSYFTAGTATTTVRDRRASFNSTAYYIVAEARPTPLLAKLYALYYKLDTLVDVYTLLPQRGSVYSEEGRRRRFKTTRFDQAGHRAAFEIDGAGRSARDVTVPAYTQDALSAIYALRSMAFKSGDRVTMPVNDNGTTYKIQVSVGTAERIKTGLGESGAWKLTLVVFDANGRPQGRNLAVWISDDARRLPVKLQADLPVGSFNLTLREAR